MGVQLYELVVCLNDLREGGVAIVEPDVVLSEEGSSHLPSTLLLGYPHDEEVLDRPTNNSNTSVSAKLNVPIIGKKKYVSGPI